jgi:hypothetical protein
VSARFRLTAIYSVPDFDRWAEVVRAAQRRVPGVERMTVHRSVDDPNEVMVELEVESVEIAQTVLKGQNLHDLLDRAGIEFYPPIFIGEQVDALSY